MNFVNILSESESQSEPTEYFLTCLIEPNLVTLGVWRERSEPQLLSVSTPKEWGVQSSLIDALELALPVEEKKFQLNRQVLFSLPEEWIQQDEIVQDKKEQIKEICHRFELKPLGFVSHLQAIFHFFYETQPQPKNSLYFEFTSQALRLFETHKAKLIKTIQVGRSEQVVSDLSEAIGQAKIGSLPSKIYFLSFELTLDQLENLKQQFLGSDLESEAIFKNLPQIELIKRNQLIEAASIVGGKEAFQLGLSDAQKESESDPESPSSQVKTFDIPVDQDKSHSQGKIDQEESLAPLAEDDGQVDPSPDEPNHSLEKKKNNWLAFFSRQKKVKDKPQDRQPTSPKPKSRSSLALGVGGFLLLVGLVAGYQFLVSNTRALVDISLKTQDIESSLTINLDEQISESDPATSTLKVVEVKKTVQTKLESATTGSTIVGEKAKGKVTILNKTNSSKTLPAGTQLKYNNLVFSTLAEVTVASASVEVSSDRQVTQFGKVDADVEAMKIGAESNLAKDLDLSVANFASDTYLARSLSAFSGGTSRESQSVAQKDLNQLKANAIKELTDQASSSLSEDLAEGEYVVFNNDYKIVKEEYSAKLDEQVNTVGLNLELELTGYKYTSQDLQPLAQAQLASQLQTGAVLLEDSVSILSKPSEATSSAKPSLSAVLSGSFIPPTDSEGWLSAIKGKTLEQAIGVLSQDQSVESVQISLQPGIMKILSGKLPSDSDRIQIQKSVKK